MSMHTTEGNRTATAIPETMRKMNAQQIVDAVWKAETTKKTAAPTVGMKMIEATAKAFFDPTNWKNPFYASWPQDADRRDAREWVKAAAIWYHADKPSETYAGVIGHGYQA